MDNDWIKLHRNIQNNKYYFSEPFTRIQAWYDLLIIAECEESYKCIRGIKITVNKGQVCASEAELSKRWNWSRGKVRRFLDELKTVQQIEQQNNNVTSLITIINFDKYIQVGTADGQQTVQQNNNKKIPVDKQQNSRQPELGLDIPEEETDPHDLDGFEKCWKDYGRYGVKKTALKYWKKLSQKDREEIKERIPFYIELVKAGRYQKQFEGWINPTNKLWKTTYENDNRNQEQNQSPKEIDALVDQTVRDIEQYGISL